MPRLRLVPDPPDAALDPVQELIKARDALLPLTTNPLISVYGQDAVESTLRILDRRIPNPQPKGRA